MAENIRESPFAFAGTRSLPVHHEAEFTSKSGPSGKSGSQRGRTSKPSISQLAQRSVDTEASQTFQDAKEELHSRASSPSSDKGSDYQDCGSPSKPAVEGCSAHALYQVFA